MQENEFEKKVQQQLNELQLRPSATVWKGVEKELQKKKKRRVIAFIFLLAGLSLLGYFTYIALPGHSVSTIAEKQHNTAGSTQLSVAPALPVISSTSKQQPEQATNNKPLPAHPSVKEDSKSEFIITQTAPHPVNKEEAIIGSTSQNSTSNKEETITGSINQNNTNNKEITTKLTNEKPANSPAASIATKDSPKKTELTSQPQTTTPDQKRAHKKMKWGFEFSPGLSYNATNPFSPVPSSKAMAVNDGLSNYSVPSGTSFPANTGYIIQPSGVKAGFAFKVGIVGEMKLSKKSSLVTGLRYAYLSDNIKVGEPLGNIAISMTPSGISTPGQYAGAYGISQKYRYTNRYHFIEIPLSYQLQLTNNKKVGLLWNAGFSASYLFATNALIYDTVAHGMYYKDKAAFTKLHINASTGLSFQFGDTKGTQWSLGPELSMDMSPLIKQNEIVKKRYLIYGGINARFFLGKNKK